MALSHIFVTGKFRLMTFRKLESITILFVVTAISFSSCNTKSKQSEVLIANGLGIFRSINFDMDIENVKKYETATLVNATEDYLRYEIQKINNTSEYVEIEYHFSKERLDLITVFYSAENEAALKKLFEEMKAYYNEKHGKAISNNTGWEHWEFEDKEGLPGNIEIMMKYEILNDVYGLDIEMVKYYTDGSKPSALIGK